MIRRVVFSLSLVLSVAAFAQVDPLRNLSGTTPATGKSPWIQSTNDIYTFFYGFDAHATYLSQTGPEEQENDVMSTNWFGAGIQYAFAQNAFVLARGRMSLEPYTIDDSYPQFFQYVPEENLIDRMRPSDLFGEAAVQFGFRPTNATLLSLYGALVGQPALGAPPAQLRSSGVDFAEAPFTYEMTETTHDSTQVVTAGYSSRLFTIEYSVFHDAFTTGDHTELDTDGDIDSRSARVILTPTPNVAFQVSRGELGEDAAQRDITSASISYGGPLLALTALWTSREYPELDRESEMAWAIELALRGTRNTFLARAEHVDRPAGFPLIAVPAPTAPPEEATHYTAGYIFDFVSSRYRMGIGVNVDYRTKTHDLEEIYGHKPQGIYAFFRIRS